MKPHSESDFESSSTLDGSKRRKKYRERKLKTKWTNEHTHFLIHEVKRREALWNHKVAEYKDRGRREELWREVARKMDIEKAEVVNKWNNIRCIFRMTYTKVKTAESTQPDKKVAINEFYYELMFLVPTLRWEGKTIVNSFKSTTNYYLEHEDDSILTADLPSSSQSESSQHIKLENEQDEMPLAAVETEMCSGGEARRVEAATAMTTNEETVRMKNIETLTTDVDSLNKLTSTTHSDDDWELIGNFIAMNGRRWAATNARLEAKFRSSLYRLISDIELEAL